MPHTLDFNPIGYAGGTDRAKHNRGALLIFAYATALGIDPYATPRAEIAARIREDISHAAR